MVTINWITAEKANATFAKKTDIPAAVDLTQYAKTTDLAPLAKTTDLAPYAKTTDLAPYAKTTDLSSYVTKRNFGRYRRRDFPGYRFVPTVNASAFTVTAGVSGAASAITGSALVPMYDTSAFTYLGTIPGFANSTFPNYNYYQANGASGNPYTGTGAGYNLAFPSGNTSNGGWQVEFDFDSTDGLFEIKLKGTNSHVRVISDGVALSNTTYTFTTAADGAAYFHLVNVGAGTHRIRLEMGSAVAFGGIQTLPTNVVTATPGRGIRCLVQGDSFAEATISDSTTNVLTSESGWPQWLAYYTGWDVWSAAKGGTGYINPGSYVTIPNRMTDITRNNPDVVIFAAGINDYAYGGASAATTSAIGAAALTSFQAVQTANPDALIIVLSPFWEQGSETFSAGLIATDDAIKAAAATVGAIYLDLLRFPYPSAGVGTDVATTAAGTLSASTAANATTFQSATKYPVGSYVQIGNDTNAEVRKVTGVTGTGPWTHTVSAMSRTHTSGNPTIPVGPSYVTGNGRQGTAGTTTGTADRLRGTDGTHPTQAGHQHIARVVYELLSKQLPA